MKNQAIEILRVLRYYFKNINCRVKLKLKIALGLLVIANIIIGSFAIWWFSKSGFSNKNALDSSQFAYLSPRIFAQNQNDIIINFVDLRTQLRDYGAQVKNLLGVYFEYLPSGVSIGVNEKQEFYYASLLKVPIVMAVYHQINDGKMSLDDELVLTENDIDKDFGDLWKKGVGYKLTVRDAINLALTQSDNTAKRALFNAMPPGTVDAVFDFLDLPIDKLNPKDEDPIVSAKNYSSILRSLYLSAYLPKDDSNEILDIMTKSKFTDGIVAGIAPGVKVAHKIGIYAPLDAQKSIYTDCGIVYVPKRPYILCVMARDSEGNAKKYIREISKQVYVYVSNANLATSPKN